LIKNYLNCDIMAKPSVKKKNVKEEGVTYVKIGGHTPLRKDILQTAINSAELLQYWESYQRLKLVKAENMEKLGKVMKKIDKEINLLKKNIPKLAEVDKLEKEEKKISPTRVTRRKPIIKKEFKSEIDKEIDDIQNKLKNLKV
tara:strand:- start:1561 stop:1989 length:429 start_codon:yes stop_codon:yes gene_type:complete